MAIEIVFQAKARTKEPKVIIDRANINEVVKSLAKNNLLMVDGRAQFIPNDRELNIVIDFAHDENSIKSIGQSIKELKTSDSQKIIVVCGSAGKRFKEKRHLMGQSLDSFADLIILTEDDPRDELVRDISNMIAVGVIDQEKLKFIDDRHIAIEHAINAAKANDFVVLLGKGTEKKMAYADHDEPYSEITTVERILKNSK